ncbi:MAG: AraC family transcriptional regulator [Planctomycetaceae bacterium]|nr:AraC family transcriptional regulator [Planctomycetaceae bacterium]
MTMNLKPASIQQSVYHSSHHPHLDVRTTLDSLQPYATHMHDCMSLGVVTSGKTRLKFAHSECLLQAGEGVLIAPEQAHSCNPVDNTLRSYHMFYIDTSWVLQALDAAEDAAIHIHNPVIRDSAIISDLTRLAEAIAQGRGFPEAGKLLSHLLAHRCSVRGHPKRLWQDGVADQTIFAAAREAGMGREGFIRHVKREVGMTPGAYRQCLRLAKARQLLRHGTDLAVTALESGFADQSHLHRMCVKYLAATPKQLKPR